MSEDPVKYEPLPGPGSNPEEYMRGFEDGRNAGWQEKGQAFFSAPASIRIEALRAAAATVRDADRGIPERILENAKQFAAYLEGGDG